MKTAKETLIEVAAKMEDGETKTQLLQQVQQANEETLAIALNIFNVFEK